jgi:CDP-diacylglycerol--serine O-phosphatidyltransferase
MIKRNIPNTITCGNLLCGCLAIVQAFEGHLIWSAYLVGIAAVLDFFDGFAARLLKVTSPIGKDLDSLADMVTFGVVPGIVMYMMINSSTHEESKMALLAFLIPVFSAIRLAKFNNDTRQSGSFIGLPTPANAILICSLPLILSQYPLLVSETGDIAFVRKLITNTYVLLGVTCILSFLLVAELPLFALKFKNFSWVDNKIKYVFLGLSLVLLVCFQFTGIPLAIILYILLSVVSNLMTKEVS